jgi:hypothetical protein
VLPLLPLLPVRVRVREELVLVLVLRPLQEQG